MLYLIYLNGRAVEKELFKSHPLLFLALLLTMTLSTTTFEVKIEIVGNHHLLSHITILE
jgi:hypothetical protein